MGRSRTTHIPRCPICHAKLEDTCQLRFGELGWEEVWGCDSCHSMHIFPARIEVLVAARNSQIMQRSYHVLHLPK